MADRFDAAARLAEGQPAVDHTQIYVQACHLVGYQHPDLTAHGAQVRDGYETEAGLDLRILDDDSAQLRVAVNTLDEALWLQRMQITDVGVAWAGPGADSAIQFLRRHCDAAAQLAVQVRTAADGYAALRDNLWQIVDRKVATTVAIDDRRAAERSTWLAAAHQVTAGTGERSEAEEVVRQLIIPYVDNDIRGDWLTAVHAATASAEAAYTGAVDALNSMPEVRFDIPGELGPRWQPVFEEPPAVNPAVAAAAIPLSPPPADPAPTVPAAPPAPAAAAPPPIPQAQPVPADLAAPLGEGAGLPTGAGDLGSIGGLAGGIGGVIGQIVDGIGGLLGSLADGFSDPSGVEDPLSDGGLDDDPLADGVEHDDDDNDDGEDNDDGDDTDGGDDTDKGDDNDVQKPEAEAGDTDGSGEDATHQDVVADEPTQNPPAAGDSVDAPVAEAPPRAAEPPENAPPPPAEQPNKTPCEIAADELPQAGR